MGLQFFTVPVRDSESAVRELNGFLASHRILSIDRQFVEVGVNSFWAICVDYLTSSAEKSPLSSNLSRSRVDYKTILLWHGRRRPAPHSVCRIADTEVRLSAGGSGHCRYSLSFLSGSVCMPQTPRRIETGNSPHPQISAEVNKTNGPVWLAAFRDANGLFRIYKRCGC